MPVSAAESGQQNGGSAGGLAAVISSTQAPAGTRTRVTRSPEPGDKPQEEGSGAAAAGASTEPPPMEFDVQVRAGNGDTFKVFVNERMKVSDLHEKISNLFACAPSAVRLVYKSKVLSHKPGETLGSFGIMPSEKPKPMLQLVVVRARLPMPRIALCTRARVPQRPAFFCVSRCFYFACVHFIRRSHLTLSLCLVCVARRYETARRQRWSRQSRSRPRRRKRRAAGAAGERADNRGGAREGMSGVADSTQGDTI